MRLSKGKLTIEVDADREFSDEQGIAPAFDPDAPAIFDSVDEDWKAADRHPKDRSVHRLSIPWTPRDVHRAKGVRDDGRPGLSDAARDQLLRAIAKAQRWIDDISIDATTFADIAKAEGCVERHVRFLAPLAFLSPALIEAIADGRVPAEMTISSLARGLPRDWATQEARLLG